MKFPTGYKKMVCYRVLKKTLLRFVVKQFFRGDEMAYGKKNLIVSASVLACVVLFGGVK